MLSHLKKTAVKTVTTTVAVITAVELTTHLPSEGRSSKIYHKVSDEVMTPLMRKYLNPEQAHNLAIKSIQNGLAPKFHPNKLESSSQVNLSLTATFRSPHHVDNSKSYRLKFPNCIGLAAGFDKDGEAIQGLFELGFGFVEIGSVTPKPQPGNDRPRLFRLPLDGGVINRFGFNSLGFDVVEQNLQAFRGGSSLPNNKKDENYLDIFVSWLRVGKDLIFRPIVIPSTGILGVNIGKNKTSTDEIKDYQMGIKQLGKYADYLVINISSPNTPGLRNLQQKEAIRKLLAACIDERNLLLESLSAHSQTQSLKNNTTASMKETPNQNEISESTSRPSLPLFVKIAPDLSLEEMKDIALAVMDCDVDGIIVCNTTVSRPEGLLSKDRNEKGGLSGLPLRDISTECIKEMYRLTNGQVFIVGVGGVGSGRDAYDKLKAGASVIQIYSRMVYEGPGLVSRIRDELSQEIVENGFKDVEDVIGLDHEEIYWSNKMKRTREMREKETVNIMD